MLQLKCTHFRRDLTEHKDFMFSYLNECKSVAHAFDLTLAGISVESSKFRKHVHVAVSDKPRGRNNLPPQLLDEMNVIASRYEGSFHTEERFGML